MVDPRTGATPPKGKGGKCLLYGCLTIIILTVLIAGVGVFLIRRFVSSTIDTVTTTVPRPVPTVSVDPDTASAARQKYQTLKAALTSGAAPEVTFNANELNALIASEPDFEPLKGHAFVNFVDDTADVIINIPLKQIGEAIPFLGWFGADISNRYVGGRAKGTFSLHGDEFHATIASLNLNGEELDQTIIGQLNDGLKQNRVIKAKDEKVKAMLDQIAVAAIENGELVVKPKQLQEAPAVTEPVAPEEHEQIAEPSNEQDAGIEGE